jgi:hypothetical protein
MTAKSCKCRVIAVSRSPRSPFESQKKPKDACSWSFCGLLLAPLGNADAAASPVLAMEAAAAFMLLTGMAICRPHAARKWWMIRQPHKSLSFELHSANTKSPAADAFICMVCGLTVTPRLSSCRLTLPVDSFKTTYSEARTRHEVHRCLHDPLLQIDSKGDGGLLQAHSLHN